MSNLDPGFLASLPQGQLLAATILILALASFVSGLGGFAFSAVASVLLWILPPLTVVPLLLALSVISQAFSMFLLREHLTFPAATRQETLPFLLGGLVGVPVGSYVLAHLSPRLVTEFLGASLCIFALSILLLRDMPRLTMQGWRPAVAVGALGGMVGGFSAFPSSVPLIYLSLRQLPKQQLRGLLQPYIIAMQLLSIAVLAWHDSTVFGAEFWTRLLACLPVVLIGSRLGVNIYHRIGDWHFRQAVLLLLLLGGTSLVAKGLLA